ncbi:hypothetical protein BCEN4_740121 [Burkholderia cenocepacia]|uniref:hypothetical protein n=1 Tax=Burkholderia cenocepacia TaxID=95486 RepID=UPI00192B5F53|nr:hypothetical protein [Burkholderia cenocepacia]CAD9228010.1 hypothetical protein BCEN4_740121 [Burkholderia cenocepacia]
MNQDKKLIIEIPSSLHRHINNVSAEKNIGVRQFAIESMLKELKAINREYATPEDIKYRKFAARNKKND